MVTSIHNYAKARSIKHNKADSSSPVVKYFFIAVFLLFPSYLFSQETKIFRRHYLILYDNSYPFYSEEQRNPNILKTIQALFQNTLPEGITGRANNLEHEKQADIPFFDPVQDEISFYYFGLSERNSQSLSDNSRELQQKKQLYSTFSEHFINPQNLNWSQEKGKYDDDVGQYLKALWRQRKPAWGNGYTLSNLVYPMAMGNITSGHAAEEYILIIVSDFLTGADFGNRQDFGLIRQLFGYTSAYYNEILDAIEFLSGKFYRIDYFDYAFPSNLFRNGQRVLLGLLAYKVRPNAGLLQPENITIKIDSDLKVEQAGYQQPYFDLSEATVNFLHNDDLAVSHVILRITGNLEQKQVTLTDTLLASFDTVVGKLRSVNGSYINIDSSRMNYVIPEFRARLKDFYKMDEVNFESITVSYTFDANYDIHSDEQIDIAYSATRTIPLKNVTFSTKTSVIIMYYVIPILSGIALILLLIWLGRPKGIQIHYDGFLDNYEKIDYHHNLGRQRFPYKPWDIDSASVKVNVDVSYIWRNYPFNWQVPYRIQLSDVQCPTGFEIQLSDGNQLYTREYSLRLFPMKLKRKGATAAWVEIMQNAGTPKVEETQSLHFEVYALLQAQRFFRVEYRTSRRYAFFIGPPLSDVWVGLDPGTTGSCIVSGINIHNMIIQKDTDGDDLITPSILAFDTGVDYKTSTNGTIDPNLYDYGKSAQAVISEKDRVSFQSIKKMLGFSDLQEITFKNDFTLKQNGKELTSLLVGRLYADHKKHIESYASTFSEFLNGKSYQPERAVVAIPNNFTSSKIQALVDSLQSLNLFKEIRYIYEAEAVLMYYLYNLKPLSEKRATLKDETVLIFDMGGATINTTVVNAHQFQQGEELKFNVDIISKLGYGIGGDTIDYCLIKFLYKFMDDYPELAIYSPFKAVDQMDEKEKEDQLRIRKEFMQAAFKLKVLLINNYISKKEYLLKGTDISDVLKEMEHYSISITIGNNDKIMKHLQKDAKGNYPLFQHKLFQELIFNNVTSATRDILALSNDAKINTVIFSGRSVLFPKIKDIVIAELEAASAQAPKFIHLKEHELKSAVAKGACLYGITRNSIVLQNTKTNGHFGVRRTRGPGEVDYVSLVEIGQPFERVNGDLCVRDERVIQDSFAADGHYVYFYQIMGYDPQQILENNEKHKISLLKKIRVDNRTERIGMQIYENDDVNCLVQDSSRRVIEEKALVSDQEIADGNDEHYTWIVR